MSDEELKEVGRQIGRNIASNPDNEVLYHNKETGEIVCVKKGNRIRLKKPLDVECKITVAE